MKNNKVKQLPAFAFANRLPRLIAAKDNRTLPALSIEGGKLFYNSEIQRVDLKWSSKYLQPLKILMHAN